MAELDQADAQALAEQAKAARAQPQLHEAEKTPPHLASTEPPKPPPQPKPEPKPPKNPSSLEELTTPPSPLSPEKQQSLQALLERYKADEITPEEYHAQRAKILAGP
jgi:hypothetical protein